MELESNSPRFTEFGRKLGISLGRKASLSQSAVGTQLLVKSLASIVSSPEDSLGLDQERNQRSRPRPHGVSADSILISFHFLLLKGI